MDTEVNGRQQARKQKPRWVKADEGRYGARVTWATSASGDAN